MNFEKLYLFNPFTIQNAESEKIAETYTNLQNALAIETDTGFNISKNIELYANMNYLIGEMIARLQKEYDTLKTEISIAENKQIYMQRKQWQETNTEKAPAMSYFEAMAKEIVVGVGGQENIEAVTNCMTRLRFTLKNVKKADENE